jgi:hypothetical protein
MLRRGREKKQNEHTCFGVVVFFWRSIVIYSSTATENTLRFLKAPQQQQRPLPPGDANREKHNWSALDSEKSLELEETQNQNPNPNSLLTHSILQNPNPNLYFKIWPFRLCNFSFVYTNVFYLRLFCIQFFRQHVNIAFQSWLWRGRLCWWVMLLLDLPLCC